MIKIILSLPKAAFASAFETGGTAAQSRPRDRENGAIEVLSDRAIELALAAHPITSVILIPVAFAAWCLGACIALLQGAAKPAFPTFHSFVRAVAPSPSTAAFASRDR